MNRKGFTLVEVILVIVIMVLLLLVLVPNIFVLVNKNKENSCNNLRESVINAAKIYVTNNKYDLGFSCEGSGKLKEITLQMLVDSGDLKLDDSNKIVNPVTDREVLLNSIVFVRYDCNSKTFSYEIDDGEIDCNN